MRALAVAVALLALAMPQAGAQPACLEGSTSRSCEATVVGRAGVQGVVGSDGVRLNATASACAAGPEPSASCPTGPFLLNRTASASIVATRYEQDADLVLS